MRVHGLGDRPQTPDHGARIPKSGFSKQLSQWRIGLHRFDPVVVANAAPDFNGVYCLDSIREGKWKYTKGKCELFRDDLSWRLCREGVDALDPTPDVTASGAGGQKSSSIATPLTKISSSQAPTTAHASEVSTRQTHLSADENYSSSPRVLFPSFGRSCELQIRVRHTFVEIALEEPVLRRRAASADNVRRRLLF